MKGFTRGFLAACLACSHAAHTAAQADSVSRSWNQPVVPFRIIDNLYYVGASDITSYLITTPAGHILLDGGLVETAPQILANIHKLGFRPEDVRILLHSQAHYDHAGGFAQLKRVTGAKLYASAGDAPVLERGGTDDFGFGNTLTFPPVKVDSIVRDRQEIRLGNVVLVANITPGHTRGCTTWTMTVREAGTQYGALFHCSTSVPGYQLVGNTKYPEIIRDYERSFALLRELRCDVFLGPHASFFDLHTKRKQLDAGKKPNPFVDPKGCREYMEWSERTFRDILKKQEAARVKQPSQPSRPR